MSIPVSGIAPPINASDSLSKVPGSVPPGFGGSASQADKQDFASLMKGFGADPSTQSTLKSKAHDPSFLEKFATVQKDNMQSLFQRSKDMLSAAPGMSLDELSMASVDFKINLAITTTQFQVATSVGKNAGKGVDTLMRNQ